MGTVADKLNKVLSTKTDIKNAIIEKGVAVSDSDTFASYGDKIRSIKGDSGGDIVEGYPLPLDELPNLEQIMADNQSRFAKYRIMYLMRDDRDTTRFPDIFYDIYTSDGHHYEYINSSSNEPHTWNKSRDIVLSDGTRWRWMLVCLDNRMYEDVNSYREPISLGCMEYIIYSSYFKKIEQRTPTKRIKFLSSDMVTITAASYSYSLEPCCEIEGIYDSAIINSTNANKFGGYVISGSSASHTFSTLRRIVETPELPSNVTELSYTFKNCLNLKKVTIDTTNMTDMYSAFYGCLNLKDISNVKFNNTTNAQYAFYECKSITETPEFNFDECQYLNYIFGDCHNLRYIKNLGGTNTKYLNYAIVGCYNLQEIDTINFTNVVDADGMFSGCSSLRYINNIIGTIKCSIDISPCVSLSKDTLIRIIKALNKSVSSKRITLGDSLKYMLTKDELRLIPSNWTVS